MNGAIVLLWWKQIAQRKLLLEFRYKTYILFLIEGKRTMYYFHKNSLQFVLDCLIFQLVLKGSCYLNSHDKFAYLPVVVSEAMLNLKR